MKYKVKMDKYEWTKGNFKFVAITFVCYNGIFTIYPMRIVVMTTTIHHPST